MLVHSALSAGLSAQALIPVSSPKTFQSSLKEPERIIRLGEGHYFIDFGKAAFGTLLLRSESPVNDGIIVHLGEKTASPGRIDRAPGGSLRYQQVRMNRLEKGTVYTLKLKKDPANTSPPAVLLPDSFGVIMPFRYCELENLSVPVSALSIRQKMYYHKFNDSSSDFVCSDTLLNRIWDLCKYSIKATSFCGLYIDGERERIPYEGDALINQLSHYSVDNEYSLARRTNEYFIHHPTWPTEWILHTVLLFYYDFLYTGDIQLVSEYYDVLKLKTLIDLEREDGLISSKSGKLTDELMQKLGFKPGTRKIQDIVDWPPSQDVAKWKLATPQGERDGYEMVDINTVVNSFHYINLKLMSVLAGELGKKEDAVFYSRRSELVRNTINEKLFDKKKGIYTDGENSKHSSLHANMFPLAFGIVPTESVKSVVSFIKSRGMACSVYGSQYLLDGLYQAGAADYAFDLITKTNSDRSWWNMLQAGTTITMEAWDMKYKPNMDWSHAWGAAPANIITRQMWGITPAAPGFSKAQIKPQLGPLTCCKIKVPTIIGPIYAEFNSDEQGYQSYILTIPEGMTAEFVFTMENISRIELNGERISLKTKTINIRPGKSIIRMRK
jgi:hypothetical protein